MISNLTSNIKYYVGYCKDSKIVLEKYSINAKSLGFLLTSETFRVNTLFMNKLTETRKVNNYLTFAKQTANYYSIIVKINIYQVPIKIAVLEFNSDPFPKVSKNQRKEFFIKSLFDHQNKYLN